MDHPALIGIFVALGSGFIGFFFNSILDLFKSGKTEKGEYLTVAEFKEHKQKEERYLTIDMFDKHKNECCILDLKKSFNLCQQDSCTVQSNHESRLKTVEERLKDGQATFKELNDKMDEKFDAFGAKFDLVNQSLAGIHATLRYALDREKMDNAVLRNNLDREKVGNGL